MCVCVYVCLCTQPPKCFNQGEGHELLPYPEAGKVGMFILNAK